MGAFTFDIESNNLLNDESVDYLASPYRLKDSFAMHCIVCESHDTGEIIAFHDGDKYLFDGRPYVETDGKYEYRLEEYEHLEYTHFPLKDFPDFVNGTGKFKGNSNYKITKVVGHNIINFDLLAIKLFFKLNYSVKYNTWGNSNIEICDTMILSKTLNPDRFGGHSLAELSKKAGGDVKIDFRKNIPETERFRTFAADMLYYCIYDNKANTAVFRYLMEEWGDYSKWSEPFNLEQRVADIITRQEHRGFAFNMKQAEDNIRDLDARMEACRLEAEPVLPPKPATKGYLKSFIPPKLQFKKNGEPSSNMIKFAEKHSGELVQKEDGWWLFALGKEFKLPIPAEEPICDPTVPATLDDTTHIKNWLVGLGWSPSEYKDKDITLKSGTKIKKDEAQMEKAIRDYVDQTLASNFCQDRCDHLECTPETLEWKLRDRIAKAKGRGVKVLTNPSFTKGQEKDICPNLEALGEKFPYATQIVQYLTYKHRRNSILGGGADWEEDEEDYDKGYLAAVRADGRIPTPAATCDAATSRMKHRLVANIPRVTSLYGYEMRNLFGVEVPKYFQIGYDFDSLEAKIESHYCVPMDAQALTRKGWVGYHDLQEGDEILGYNPETGLKEWTKVKGKVFYKNSKTFEIKGKSHTYRATADHRWYVNTRSTGNTYVPKVRTTAELCTGDNIICNAPFNMEQDQVNSLTSVQQGKWDVPWVERVVNMSHAERVAFLEGFLIADGYWHEHKQKPVWRWAQNPGELFEAALTASYLVHGGNISVAFNTKEQKVKVATLANRSHIPVQSLTIEEWGVEDVWCPQTELGTWVMRQKDCITITGNCWRYEQEPHEYCNALLLEKPNDVHTMMARRISDTIGRKFERSPAKSVKYGITYGAQAAKVAKTIGSDMYTGQLVYDAFWEAAKPLALLKERLHDFWVKTGKKYILGIDGRKVPTRSAHAILNSLFQSGGVICAKRAMVIYDDLIEEEGLAVDFFVDDWQNKSFVQQMIAYHDEAQLEVTRDLVHFKWFSKESLGWTQVDDPEEQKKIDKECLDKVNAWKEEEEKRTGKIWANVHESPKGGWFTAYSRAGELASIAVNKAGEYYNLNVPLTAGYDVGSSWSTCH